jgi:hypothetical protein
VWLPIGFVEGQQPSSGMVQIVSLCTAQRKCGEELSARVTKSYGTQVGIRGYPRRSATSSGNLGVVHQVT